MMNRLVAVTYHFLLEVILGLLFLFFFYIERKELPPILIVLGLCLGGLIPFIILLEKFTNKGIWLYFVIVFPLLLVMGTTAHFSIYIVSLLGFFIFWRGISLYGDFTGHSETLFLFLSFLLGIIVIIYSTMIHYPYQSVIIFLLILQIVMVLAGSFLHKWKSITEDKLRFALYYIKIIGAVSLIGTVITFFIGPIQLLFFGLFKTFVMLFANLVTPILKIIVFILSLFGKGERVPQLHGSDMRIGAGKYKEGSFIMSPNLLYLLLLLIAVAFIIYYIYKKRLFQQTTVHDHSSIVEISTGSQLQGRNSIFKKRVKPPEDHIRREIFHLEKYAHKLNVGRLPFETLDEWWQRVGLNQLGQINKIYEKVRYGLILSTIEEQVQVKAEIHQLKKQIKEIAENQKKK